MRLYPFLASSAATMAELARQFKMVALLAGVLLVLTLTGCATVEHTATDPEPASPGQRTATLDELRGLLLPSP